MSNAKRMGLYFNLDNPTDKLMWDYLNRTRKKSDTIKTLIFNAATNSNNTIPLINIEKTKEELKDTDIDDDGINL